MRFAFISAFLALASLAVAAPLPAGAALERRFDLVQGHVVPGEGYVPTATVHLANTPTEIPSTENGGSYFYLPDSLNMIDPPADVLAKREALVKRLTPFLLVRPQSADAGGAVPDFVELAAAESENAVLAADDVE